MRRLLGRAGGLGRAQRARRRRRSGARRQPRRPRPPQDPEDPEQGDDDDGDDPEDPEDPAPDDGWDSGEPAVADGSRVTMVLDCGLLDGPQTETWEKNGEVWDEIWTETSTEGLPLEDLLVCFERPGDGEQRRDKYLQWHEDGFIYIEAAGMAHDNQPTETEGFWIGEVYLHAGSTPECDAALAERGLSWPVPMSLTLVEVVEPAS